MKKIVFMITSLMLLSTTTFSQWVQTNVPGGGLIMSFASSGTNIFAGTYGGGVFVSSDNGTNWVPVNSGLTTLDVWALAANVTNLYAGTHDGMFLSTDNGKNWTSMHSYPIITNVIGAIMASDTNVFVGTLGQGVFLTANSGATWTEVNTGLTNLYVRAFAKKDSNLFACTDGGAFRSTNNGTSWVELDMGLTNTGINALMAIGSNLYAGTNNGDVVFSTNNGATWNKSFIEQYTYVDAFAARLSGTGDTILFAGTNGSGVFQSTNNGASWTRINTGLSATAVFALLNMEQASLQERKLVFFVLTIKEQIGMKVMAAYRRRKSIRFIQRVQIFTPLLGRAEYLFPQMTVRIGHA